MRIVTTVLASLLLATNAAHSEDTRQAPDWTRSTAAGDSVTLSSLAAEKPVVLLFWATWCPYCKAVMPHIQSIKLEYGDDVHVLALHFRDDKGDPVAFIENRGYDFTLVPDSTELAKQYGVWGTPAVMIVDADRTIRFDLYELPPYDLPGDDGSAGHAKKAAYKAPYWAAEIRRQLDEVLADYDRPGDQ